MGREPIRDHHGFQSTTMRWMIIWGVRRRFHRLYPGDGHVAHALRTLAPVAGVCIATNPLPLDLHVLSLPLAFILSQDQTLLCILTITLVRPRQLHSLFKKSTLSIYNMTIVLGTCLYCSPVFSMIVLKNPIRLANGNAKVHNFFKLTNFFRKILKFFMFLLVQPNPRLKLPST